MTTNDGNEQRRDVDRAFARYRRTGDPGAIATLFDLTAGELRRVAGHVVSDAATADDLVQATYLAAIENAASFDGEREVLPWLTGILRKQALLVHRRERRRPDPRRLPEPSELDPVRSAESAELDAEVGASIAQLPEAYRPVMQLYLLHGLGAAEIATTLERPAGTVRTQIVRGLEKLRALLPVGLAGLLAGLLPAVGTAGVRRAVLAAATRHAAATTTMGLGGILAMKKTLAGVAAALIVLAAGWWTMQSGGRDRGAPVVATAASPMVAGSEGAKTEPGPVETPAAVTRRTAVDTAAPAGAIVRGRVVRDGRPVPGATVMAWRGEVHATAKVDGAYDPPPDRSTIAGDDGAFELAGVPEAFLLSAEHDTLDCVTRLFGSTQGRAELVGLELELAPTLQLEGTLRDHEGRPVAGHPVGTNRGSSNSESDRTDVPGVWRTQPVFLQTTTDAEGRFSVRALAEHRYQWEVQHPQHPILRVAHRARDGRLELRLEEGVRVAGRVFRADGSAAAGAEVILEDYPTRRATCDASGAFALRGAELRDESFLLVADPKSAVFALQPMPASHADLHIRLEPPRRIAGRVVDGDGQPLASVAVSIAGDRRIDPGYLFEGVPTWEWAHDIEDTTTGHDGSFAFDRLYDGDFELQVESPDGQRRRRQTVRSGASRLEIQLDDSTAEVVTLRGRATDATTGEPLQALRLTVWRRMGASSTGRTHDVSTDNGAYELTGLAPGDFVLSAVAAGFATVRVPERTFASGTHTVDIAAYPVRQLDIEVRDTDGVALPGSVSARDAEGKPLWIETGLHGASTSRSLRDGRAELIGLPAMRVTVVVAVAGVATPIERIVDLIEPLRGPVTITVGAAAPRVDVELGVLCCTADADLSAFAGEPNPSWMKALASRDDVWAPETDVAVRLLGTNGETLMRGTIEAGEPAAGEGGWKARRYASRLVAFDGSETSTAETPAPVAPAMLQGRREAMTLHLEATGYEPQVLEIEGAGGRTRVVAFLRARR